MPKLTLVCPVCSKSFDVYPTEARRGRRYCSRSCAMVTNNAKRPPKPTGTTLQNVTCEQCKAVFKAAPHEIRGGRRFCSKRCRAFWQVGERSNRYKGGLVTVTCGGCGKEFERAPSQTRQRVYCSRECKDDHLRGPNSPSWKGGRFIGSEGYVYIYMPDHPNAMPSTGYVGEHVIVAAQKIGRPLRPGEEAHHDNEIKTDNSPSNIVVLTASEHKKLHHERRIEKLK